MKYRKIFIKYNVYISQPWKYKKLYFTAVKYKKVYFSGEIGCISSAFFVHFLEPTSDFQTPILISGQKHKVWVFIS